LAQTWLDAATWIDGASPTRSLVLSLPKQKLAA
jgi:hypothetical protein